MAILAAGMWLSISSLSGCSSVGPSAPEQPAPMDEAKARSMLADRDLHVPDRFEFIRGVWWPVHFAGTPRIAAHFIGPRSVSADAVDVSYPVPLHDVECTEPVLAAPMLGELGFDCASADRVLVARSFDRGDDASLQLGESLTVLAVAGTGTELYVVNAGT